MSIPYQERQGSSEPARVLLVEEDPRAAALVRSMIRTSFPDGLLLSHTERLADATQELLERGSSCVILATPVASPLVGLEQLNAAAPDVPLVALIDIADDALAVRALAAGAQDCLVKRELSPVQLRRSILHAIERKRSEVRLAHQALHDPLTRLPNRALFLDRLGVALDRSKRTNGTIAVLFLDVDNFKQVNDTLGHGAGDRLLVELAERLRAMLRPMDTVARFGGDEFTLLFEDLASEREVVLIAERVSRAAAAPVALEGRQTAVTVSMGISIVSDPTVPADTVIREADAAMYRAKDRGRSRYELFDEASRQRASDRLELEADLRQAVDEAQLRVHYQPTISLNGHAALAGFEALVRWEHPRRGLIAPGEFIPIAEETGLMVPIGEFVLQQALAQLVSWRHSRPEVTVSVNLSPRQLADAGLVTMLAAAMRGSEVEPGALCLEVTERALSEHPDTAVRALQGIKALGVEVAIDDYGTGPSLLSNLSRLHVDALKIHESFVRALGADDREATIVGAVIELGHALGLSVVAEGVETDIQLAQLRQLGCDGAQGYLFGAAMSEEQAEALISGD